MRPILGPRVRRFAGDEPGGYRLGQLSWALFRESMVWGRLARVAVIAAALAGAPSIACAQNGSTKSVLGDARGTGSDRSRAERGATTGITSVDSVAQAPRANSTRGNTLMPCRPGPPYTSPPRLPVRQ